LFSRQTGLFLPHIELHEMLALLHHLAGGKSVFGNGSCDFVANFKLTKRDNRADGLRRCRPFALLGADGSNGFRRLRKGSGRGNRSLNLIEFVKAQAAGGHDDRDEHDKPGYKMLKHSYPNEIAHHPE
jgi:hypothetical protein